MPATESPPAPAKGEIKLGKPANTLAEKLMGSADKYGTPPAESVKSEAPNPEPAKPEPAKPAAVATPEKKVDPEPKKPDEEKKPKEPKELREALDRTQALLEESRAEGTLSKKSLAEFQLSIQKTKDDLARREKEIEEEYKPKAKRLEEVDKKLQEKEAILKVTSYTSTDEWREKYDKPLSEARANVELLMSELAVQTPEGTARRATFEDFASILKAPTLTQAHALAEQIFGPGLAAVVVGKRTEMQGMVRAREAALKNAELEATKYYEGQQVRHAQSLEESKNRLAEVYGKIKESEPDAFNAGEDAEAAKEIQEAERLADRIIIGDPTMTTEERITACAEIRAGQVRAKAYKRAITKRDARITELETQLKEFQSSEPGVGGGNSGTPPQRRTNNGDPIAHRESTLADMAARAAKYGR